MASGSWFKRIVIALVAAIAALFVSRKTVLAPGKSESDEFRLPPVPDARASGPEDATPLTEDEQVMMASRAPEFKGFSAPVREAVDTPEAPGPDEATPLTEEERAAFEQRLGVAESGDEVPAPISYEIAQENADAAEALREAGDAAGAEALEQRIYFTAPEATVSSDTETLADDEILEEVAEDVAAHESTGEAAPGDTSPDPTSEAFDVVTDGADHTGQEPIEADDPTEVGLDIDVDLEDDEPIVPELTSEGFDTSEEALGIESGAQEETHTGFITVAADQTWCPDDYPIKGNANSRIFHKPGESSYEATNPEICFATEDDAVGQGYRPRKR